MSLVPVDETYTKHGASVYARAINLHWKARGYPGIRTDVVPVSGSPVHWTVTSNVGASGYPPR